jgi:hypothetical protein
LDDCWEEIGGGNIIERGGGEEILLREVVEMRYIERIVGEGIIGILNLLDDSIVE